MKAQYRQLHGRGKQGRAALVACMRKLQGIVNANRRYETRTRKLVMAWAAASEDCCWIGTGREAESAWMRCQGALSCGRQFL